jgi:hypothetical protein
LTRIKGQKGEGVGEFEEQPKAAFESEYRGAVALDESKIARNIRR